MTHKRAHIVLPESLLADIDALVGPRGRSAFLAETVRQEIRRRHLLEVLNDPKPILDRKDYPEFRKGGAAFERRLREQDLRRDKKVLKDWPPRS
jgi:TnpA family transposase